MLRIITIYGSDSKIIICDQHLTGRERGSTILPARSKEFQKQNINQRSALADPITVS